MADLELKAAYERIDELKKTLEVAARQLVAGYHGFSNDQTAAETIDLIDDVLDEHRVAA